MKKPQSAVDKLIASKQSPSPFTEPMLADIREVLAANDAQPNRLCRVTAEQMRAHLCDVHGYPAQRWTFDRHIRAVLGRGWAK